MMEEDVSSKQLQTTSQHRPSSTTSLDEKSEDALNGVHVKQEQTPGDSYEGKGKASRFSTRKRKSSCIEGNRICPVCGLTVRPSELEQHFQYEIEQLDQIVQRQRIKRDSQASYAQSREKDRESKRARHKKAKAKRRANRRQKDDSSTDDSHSDVDTEEESKVNAHMTLLEVRANRHARERKKALIQNPSCNPETMLCPVCFQPLTGSEVERNQHVENCLTTQPSTSTSAEMGQEDTSSIDVEGEEDGWRIKEEGNEDEEIEETEGGYDTYEWMGETRVRAVSLVPGGYQGLGYQTASTKVKNEIEDDDDLDVDGDETEEFGPQQYTELDISARCPSRTSQDTGDVGYEDHVSDNLLIEGCIVNGTSDDRCMAEGSSSPDKCRTVKHVGLPSSGIQIVVESLKARVRELEGASGDGRGRLKCQICLDCYKVPLVSIQCWHVHCEQCWLQCLAFKKLCPQCQLITAPSQLRRIYL